MGDRTHTSEDCNPVRHNLGDTDAAPDAADNPRMAHALHYLSLGLPPVPLCPPSC